MEALFLLLMHLNRGIIDDILLYTVCFVRVFSSLMCGLVVIRGILLMVY